MLTETIDKVLEKAVSNMKVTINDEIILIKVSMIQKSSWGK